MLNPPIALGAHLRNGIADFAVRSHHADAVDLILEGGGSGERRLAMARGRDDVWRVTVPGLLEGGRYGLRVVGPHDPARGLLFDPGRLLIDPYARAVDGDWCVLVDAGALPQTGVPPRTPMRDTLIYETHVRGLTRLHPDVPPQQRGTYAGLAHPAVIEHLLSLGVTAVQLMPVHEHRTERSTTARGLANYWGYSTVGFFAPHAAYSSCGARGGQVSEFRAMVAALHAAGIEVILDVVFNHSCEGGVAEPPICFRGLDNPSWYWLETGDPSRYVDVTGCGNTLDPESPTVQRMVLDSLRYWVHHMGVDGFRFDLGVVLGRTRFGYRPDAPLLRAICEDRLLEGVKLIAEPWDLGLGGYQVGNFPAPFADHNGVFRDVVRDLWRGRSTIGMLAGRMAGGEDTYAHSGRGPTGAVNFITAHDGFTLADLVAHDHKHNLANKEGNQDGESHNRSWNSGVEGPSNDPAVRALRGNRARGLMATLLLSVGVPMMLGGDEISRSQSGNNNAYCQDSPLSWTDWSVDDDVAAMLTCVRRLSTLRSQEPLLRRDAFLSAQDVTWLAHDGGVVHDEMWNDQRRRALGMLLRGRAVRPARPDLLVLVNVGPDAVSFSLPEQHWYTDVLDTSHPDASATSGPVHGAAMLGGWSVRVLRRRRAPAGARS